MLYIVWIWWLFGSEEVVAILHLGTEPCLAYKPTAALLWYWCCTDAVRPRAPSVPRYGGVCCPLSCPACASASRKKFLKGSCLRCFASLFHTLIYSLRSLIWPALTQLCCKVWASCVVWSLGQREEFLHFRRGDRLSKPASQASCLPCPESAARKWKYNPVCYGRVFLYWRVLKRRPKTPCVIGAGLSQFGQPGKLQSIPCTAVQVPAAVPNHHVAVGSALVWAKAAAGYLAHCRGCRGG